MRCLRQARARPPQIFPRLIQSHDRQPADAPQFIAGWRGFGDYRCMRGGWGMSRGRKGFGVGWKS